MPAGLEVTDVQISFVEHGRDGLLGWVSFVIGGAFRLNNIALRQGQRGGVMLTFPVKLTGSGTRQYQHHPICAAASALLARAVLAKVRELLGPSEEPLDEEAR